MVKFTSTKNSKKGSRAFTIILIVILAVIGLPSLVLLLFLTYIDYVEDTPERLEKFQAKTYNSEFEAPTKKEMLSDYEYVMDLLETSVPAIDEGEALYGVSFEEKKAEYDKLADECETPFDFYCLLKGITADVPSCHTNISYVSGNLYKAECCIGVEKARKTPNLYGNADGWFDYLSDEIGRLCGENSASDIIPYVYCDGHYMNNEFEDKERRELYGEELLELNGCSAVDFIADNLFENDKQFDFKNNLPYRYCVLFNSCGEGEKVTALVKNSDGSEKEVEFYYSLNYETAYLQSGFYSDKYEEFDFVEDQKTADESAYEIYDSPETDTVYINLLSFHYRDGEAIAQEFSKYADRENIIFDIRENNGGFVGFWQDYVYVPFFSNSKAMVFESYYENTPYSENKNDNTLDKDFYKDLPAEDFQPPYESGYEWRMVEALQVYTGDYDGENSDRNFYILTGRGSYSCADEFACSMKDCATLVGGNTGGEGMHPTYMCQVLPKTKLMIKFSPYITYNEDGSSNSLYGTKPHVYSTLSREDFLLKTQIRFDGGDAFEYENRIKWDTELKLVYDMIEQAV